MIKVGDKIQIKKQETTLESTFTDILNVLKSSKMKEHDKLDWCNSALSILEEMYKQDELGSVKVAKAKLIPILHKLIEGSKIENMALFFDYYSIISGRFQRNFKADCTTILIFLFNYGHRPPEVHRKEAPVFLQ